MAIALADRIQNLRTLQQESEERRQRAIVAEKEVIEAFLDEWHQLPPTTRKALFDTLSNQMKAADTAEANRGPRVLIAFKQPEEDTAP